MDDLEKELELAVAELGFWLDYARWWRSRHDAGDDTRMLEVLELAQRRYAAAEAACCEDNSQENEERRRKPLLREVK